MLCAEINDQDEDKPDTVLQFYLVLHGFFSALIFLLFKEPEPLI